ncbi:MAG: translation initiation factor IF-2 [Candidatus Taylorbacteria bacterium]|nr:translation initiation factor IF-2 [Candidatus Taylorbacteria bacterium]
MVITNASPKSFKTRPPVVVIMGHIDHGKSTLLDYIRKSNVAGGEAGGITQHLGAYEVAHVPEEGAGAGKSGLITFLDTPGHEAFTGIRERGASAADIAILIVSGEDGVKPQTVEAYECIKKANIPFIVAITKIDKPSADIERTKISLAENEIYLEGYGGDISFVPISSVTGKGIPELLDMITLMADVADLRANFDAQPSGIVVEAHLNPKKGIAATLIVKEGVLTSGMHILADDAISPVRIFENCYGRPIKEAKPGRPARVIGFDKIPGVGSIFHAFKTKKEAEVAREIYKEKFASDAEVAKKAEKIKKDIADRAASSISSVSSTGEKIPAEAPTVTIPLIIKADTVGSLEGIRHEMKKLVLNGVILHVIYDGIGEISESDVKAGMANPATYILGFNVEVDPKAAGIVERSGVKVKTWNIIYKLVEFLAELVKENKPKVYVDEATGTLKVMQVFSKAKDKQIIGGKVQQGFIKLGSEVKILRRDAEIGRGKIRELQQNKKKTEEVNEGYECGLLVEAKIEITIGDKIQCFVVKEL